MGAVSKFRPVVGAVLAACVVLGAASPAMAAPTRRDSVNGIAVIAPASPDPAVDPSFDVTKYGDRGGPTDAQVAIVVIFLFVLLAALFVGGIWWAVRWQRRRDARVNSQRGPGGPGPGGPGGPFPTAYPPAPPGLPGYGPQPVPPGYGPQPVPPGYGPQPQQVSVPAGYPPPPGGSAGYAPPPVAPPQGYAPPPVAPPGPSAGADHSAPPDHGVPPVPPGTDGR